MVSRLSTLRQAFLVTASFPIAFLLVSPSAATDVTVSTSRTATDVNTDIAAAVAAGRDVNVTVTAAGAIAGPPNVQLNPAGAGKGDGKIGLSNAGLIGTLSTDGTSATNSTAVLITGAGQGTTDNTATLANTNLITGNFAATNFGGDVSLSNSGVVGGSVNGSGYGNSTVTTATGSVVHGNVTAQALETDKSTTAADGTITGTVTGGAASAALNGDVVGFDGKTGGAVFVSGVTDSSATVNGIAGTVTVQTVPSSPFTSGPNTPAAAGQTVTTSQSTNTANPGTAEATIGATGSVTSVQAFAVTASTVKVSGAVTGNANAFGGTTDSTFKATQTENGTGITTATTSNSSFTPRGPAATVTIDKGASVGGFAQASGLTSATVADSGTVKGTIFASSQGTSQTTTSTSNADDTGVTTATTAITTQAAAGGLATVTVASGATAQGTVQASGDGGASITNAGTIGLTATPVSVGAFSQRTITSLSETDQTFTATGSSKVTKSETRTVGGGASVTNSAGGLIEGSISASGLGGVTLVNNGTVRGTTFGSSLGTISTSQTTTTSDSVVTKGTPPALDVTTTTATSATNGSITNTGGSVNGTYGGANGTLNFTPATSGAITQLANKDSNVTISGSVFGTVSSTGGSGSNTTSTSNSKTVTALDSSGAGTQVFTASNGSTTNSLSGSSTVTINGGQVAIGNAGAGATVSSSGTNAAAVTITNGRVEQTTSATATGLTAGTTTGSSSYAQNYTGFAPVATTAAADSTASQSKMSGGAATIAVTGTSTLLGSVSATGNSAASVTIGTGSTVGTTATNASVSATAGNGTDSTSSTTRTFAYDTKTTLATETVTSQSSFAPSATGGNAAVVVGGTVNGTASTFAYTGDASTTVNGTVGSAFASTGSSASQSTTTSNYSSKLATAPTGTSIGTLPLPLLASSTSTFINTATGGKASVTVDSSDALKALGTAGATFVSASGLGGGTATVTAGSIVSGSVFASSSGFTNTSSTTTNTYNATGVQTGQTSSSSATAVGTSATIANAGTIGGTASASGTTAATVTNSGKVSGFLTASAIGTNSTTSSTITSLNDAALENQVTTTTTTQVGGVATITNAAGAVTLGGASLIGGTGTLTNNGTLVGTTTLGTNAFSSTSTTTRTASSTTQAPVALPATLFTQTYTVNQNGASGGFAIANPTVLLNASDTTNTKVTNINTTINLNDGSVTLGSITAPVDSKTQARLTNTTVNLNGSGYLGLDAALPTPNPAATAAIYTPEATLTKDATTNFGTGARGVTVAGVTALNKTGAGTFVISGVPYIAPTVAGVIPPYSLNVGAFNINGGEVQLSVVSSGTVLTGTTVTANAFGINGDVNNNATLVIGRRVPPAASLTSIIGNNLTGNGEHVAGTTLVVNGNYTQGSTGTTVVGLTPSLVRAVPLSVLPVGLASDTLGVATPLVTVGYFTTVPNAIAAGLYTGASSSKINVTGNVTLAGNVVVDVSRDGLYSSGDGGTLITYTGTADVSKATASSSLTSPFVKFALVNDTTAKTVSVSATRTSYATGATNPNAVSAAVGLDSAIGDIVNRIKTDASGGASFTSASQIGYSQDLANVVSALDWRLSTAQAAEVFNELSSAEIYGSLSAVNQNAIFGDTVSQLVSRPLYSGTDARTERTPLAPRLWLTPAGSFAKYSRTASGASPIKVDSYGVAGGVDFGYLANGSFGIGAAYGHHRVDASGTPEKGTVKTFTVGAYFTQGFGNFYVNGELAYGFSRFDIDRTLPLLARTINGRFHGHQLDASLEGGYDFDLNGAVVTPFAKVAVRNYGMNAFTETGGGGAGLSVDGRKKSVFLPTIGVKLGGTLGDIDTVAVRPYAKASYTFQGDLGTDRTVTYLGGGGSFVLRGVDPGHYGTIEAGLEGSFSRRVNMFVGGSYSFGSGNKVGSVRAGVGFNF